MIAHASLPDDCLADCTDEDRAALLRAGLSQTYRFASPLLAFVSLSLPDSLERIRARKASGRIVLALATIAQKAQRVAAMTAGADEFLTTAPIDPAQLDARLQFLATGAALPAGLMLDRAGPALVVDGTRHELTPKEFAICEALIEAKGGAVTHAGLLSHAWDDGSTDRQRLRVTINRLRRRIEPEPDLPRYFLSEPVIGYRIGIGQSSRPVSAM